MTIVDCDRTAGADAAADIAAQGGSAFAVHADITDEEAIEKLFADTVQRDSRIDVHMVSRYSGYVRNEGLEHTRRAMYN